MKQVVLTLITSYQQLFPFRGNCRFYPTCSDYAKQAIEKYGLWKGSYLAFKRLASCHPFGKSGVHMVK